MIPILSEPYLCFFGFFWNENQEKKRFFNEKNWFMNRGTNADDSYF